MVDARLVEDGDQAWNLTDPLRLANQLGTLILTQRNPQRDAPVDSFEPAEAAARRALEIDPTLAEAHASLGFVQLYYRWNWLEAEKRNWRVAGVWLA